MVSVGHADPRNFKLSDGSGNSCKGYMTSSCAMPSVFLKAKRFPGAMSSSEKSWKFDGSGNDKKSFEGDNMQHEQYVSRSLETESSSIVGSL